MSTLSIVLSITLPVLAIVFSVFMGLRTMKKTGDGRRAIGKHFITLIATLVISFSFTFIVAGATSANPDTTGTEAAVTTAATTTNSDTGLAKGLALIGAGLSMGLAAVGAGVAVSGAAPAAIGAVAEDPKALGKSLLFVSLGEGVMIFGFIIAIMIYLKV